jgi:hypothetical protein
VQGMGIVRTQEVGEQLARKHRVQRPSGFDFDKDSLVDDPIRPKSVLECWCMRTPATTTAPLITFSSSTPAPPCSRCRCMRMMAP